MNDWRHVPLSEVVTRVTTKNVGGINENVLTVSAAYGLIAQGSFFTKKVASKDTSGYYVVAPGQFVYNKSTSKSAAYGTVARNLSDEPGIVSPLYFVLEANDGAALPEYLELALNSDQFFGSLAGTLREGARSHGLLNVRLKEFYAATVTLPPIPMQERIVQVIRAVDDQINALDIESMALEGILESLRSDVPQADHQPIGDVLLGIDSGKSVQAGIAASAEDEYRILKLSAVQRGWFKPSEAKVLTEGSAFSPSHMVKNGDLLITRANTPERVGFVAVAKNVSEGTFMPDLIWRLRVDESRVSTGYLQHALSSRELRTSISGVSGGTSKSMVKINKRSFGAVRVPIPPLPDQGEYVRRCDAVGEGITATRAEGARLRQIRAGLLRGLLDRTIDIEPTKLEV